MPSFNQMEYITESITSVLEQDYCDVELIVADGGSDDGTIDVLHEISEKDFRLKWSSEKDSGPAEALNKALEQSKGLIIGWLNSDDLYAESAIKRAIQAFNNHPEWIMLYGNAAHIDEKGEFINEYPTLPPEEAYAQFKNGCFICQPTVFFKRTMYQLIGPLNQDFKAAFDFEYWLRAFNLFENKIGFIDELQAYSRLHNECITQKHRERVAIEGVKAVSNYYGKAPIHWIATYVEECVESISRKGTDENLIEHLLEVILAVDGLVEADDLCQLKTQILQSKVFERAR
jgi:glycosyltransferase involved in cell wall biosynthesis